MAFVSSDGYRIFVGRNNRQNDLLSLKTARKDDLWLHVQKFHGTHVIIDCHGTTPPDETITEAAQLDGAGAMKTFFRIKLPYLSSSILFVTILSVINSFKVFREVYLLTGDYPYDSLYLLQHFMNNMFKSLDYQRLSAAAILMVIVMIVIIGILFLIDRKLEKDIEE